jgi:hypothetical protein
MYKNSIWQNKTRKTKLQAAKRPAADVGRVRTMGLAWAAPRPRTTPGGAQLGLLLGLPHEVLVDLFVRLDPHALGRLAATCRLLQHGQRSPESPPNPVEDALRLRAEQNGWSRTLPVDARKAVKSLLRLAWQHNLEFHSISAGCFCPASLFLDSGGSLRACGVELLYTYDTSPYLDNNDAAAAGSLGFGTVWCLDSGSHGLRKEEPTVVPAAASFRMRSVAMGLSHSLALTDEGQVYRWGSNMMCGAAAAPTLNLFEEASERRKMRRVAAGGWNSAALTDEGKLYTWQEDEDEVDLGPLCGAGTGFPFPDQDELKNVLCRPRCVGGPLAKVRIVSVAAGELYTIVATDGGVARHPPEPAPATCPDAISRNLKFNPETLMPGVYPTQFKLK